MQPNLLILAGGRGTRMASVTCNNHYPKLLVSLGNQTMLDRMLETYSKDFDRIGIVLSELDHIDMVEKWIKRYHSNLKERVQIIFYPKTDGTLNTFRTITIRHPEFLTNTVLHWSDIILQASDVQRLVSFVSSINTNNDFAGFIVTDNEHRHRIGFDLGNQQIKHTSDMTGNMPGIYFMKDWDPIANAVDRGLTFEVDIANQLSHHLDTTVDIFDELAVDLIDIGDAMKYNEFMQSVDLSARYFNQIKIVGNEVYKSAANEKGRSVIEHENAFYDQATLHGWPFPKRLAWNSTTATMTLQKVDGQTINQYLNEHDHLRSKIEDVLHPIMASYMSSIRRIHETPIKPGRTSFTNDLRKEYIDVTNDRINEIAYLIPSLDATSAIIDGVEHEIDSYSSAIERFAKLIDGMELLPAPIHGDTNTSNTMIDRSNRIVFIDPRGKFGDSTLIGDPAYDIAKFVYGLHAYDGFNQDKHFTLGWQANSSPLVPRIQMSHYGYPLDEVLACIPGDDEHRSYIGMLVGLIFVKLTAYIKNNPSKVIASYYYGMHLLKTYMDQYEYERARSKVILESI